jgi:hypothetical protein
MKNLTNKKYETGISLDAIQAGRPKRNYLIYVTKQKRNKTGKK